MMRVYLKGMESLRPEQSQWYHAGRDPVPDEPVRWRETQVEGIAPFAALRWVPTWMAISLIVLASAAFVAGRAVVGQGPQGEHGRRAAGEHGSERAQGGRAAAGGVGGVLPAGAGAMFVWSLVVGIRCSGSIALEREKQTWEAVLLTPMTAKQIVRGKLWGVMGASSWYLMAYAARRWPVGGSAARWRCSTACCGSR